MLLEDCTTSFTGTWEQSTLTQDSSYSSVPCLSIVYFENLHCPLVVFTHNYCPLFTYFLFLPLDLQMNTTVFIVWAMHSTSDSNSGFTAQIQHTSRGWSAREYNLIAEAMAAAMTPTTTTMMMPSTSVVSTPQPTGNDRCQYK